MKNRTSKTTATVTTHRDGSRSLVLSPVKGRCAASRVELRPVTFGHDIPDGPLPITRVIFRKIQGEVIALFPEIPADLSGNIESYMHTGQHGAASPSLSRSCPLATPQEYAPLAAELARIGYVLDIKTRSCPTYAKARREALARA